MNFRVRPVTSRKAKVVEFSGLVERTKAQKALETGLGGLPPLVERMDVLLRKRDNDSGLVLPRVGWVDDGRRWLELFLQGLL